MSQKQRLRRSPANHAQQLRTRDCAKSRVYCTIWCACTTVAISLILTIGVGAVIAGEVSKDDPHVKTRNDTDIGTTADGVADAESHDTANPQARIDLANGKVRIETITFKPTGQDKFKEFEDKAENQVSKWVDVIPGNTEALPVTVPNPTATAIRVTKVFNEGDLQLEFPLHVEGLIQPGGGAGAASTPYWAVKVTPVYAVDVKIVKPEAQQPWHYTDDIMADYEIVRRTESLKFIIFLNRAISSLNQFGSDITVSTLDQQERVDVRQMIALNEDDQLAHDGKSIRVTVTNQELAGLHYLEELPPLFGGYHVSIEGVTTTNYNDGNAFEAGVLGTTGLVMGRGIGNWTDTATGVPPSKMPAWSAMASVEQIACAGSLYLDVECGQATDRGMLQKRAAQVYISSHGDHASGTISAGVGGGATSGDVDWAGGTVDKVFIAGCSVLDVDDLNSNFPPPPPGGSYPGRNWATTGPRALLGYNYTAPTDNADGDPEFTAKIIQGYLADTVVLSDSEAWRTAHEDMAGPNPHGTVYNSCAIIRSGGAYTYYYFDQGTLSSTWTAYPFTP